MKLQPLCDLQGFCPTDHLQKIEFPKQNDCSNAFFSSCARANIYLKQNFILSCGFWKKS